MKPAIGINDFLATKFEEYPFDGDFEQAFGLPEKNFKMMIYGPEKHGKTDFCVKFAKYISQWGKVYYNSHEEGRSKTLRDCFIRNNMQEVAGKVMLLHKEPYEGMMERLAKKGSPRFLVIDSLDYMELKEKQFKELVTTFPRKSIIMLSWCDAKEQPLRNAAKLIAKRVDIKCFVKNRTAYPTSRFGGNKSFVFGESMMKTQPGQQLTLINS